ncbi:DUF4271 domain-containing protein [Leeuwenhoekiella sp. MAR_2009_132]|uniref:DUF4271 domain-containing protein n=1 Tax=Leeuwenhoekiella sp. MAR_2009_132 TaxID=1392489 RepID=UPI000490DC6C|nr:DUF4271 domain-containing protein [Leeuwenhoekiella sp. MAR_2009_132]
MQALERSFISNDWITIVFVACLALIVLVKVAYETRFIDFTELLINEKYLLKANKEIKFQDPFNLILFVAQLLSVSLFIQIALTHFGIAVEISPVLLYIRIALVYVVFIALKFFIERMMGVLFSGEHVLSSYQFQKLSYRSFFALILLPVNALFVYGINPSLILIKIIIGVFVLFNLISLFNTLRKYEKLIYFNLFYFILYLCALEIAPYFILYKVFSMGVN